MRKLGEFIKLQGGYAFKSSELSDNKNGHPVIKIGNITGGSFVSLDSYQSVSDEVFNKTKLYQTEPNDILIAMTGANVGKVSRVPYGMPKSVINQRVGRFVLKDNCKYSQNFIYYLVSSKKSYEYFSRIADGAAQPNISGSLIESLEFPDIEPEDANRIGEFLKYLDDKIQLNTQTNQTLEAITQAIFKSWFVDFDPVRAKAVALSEGKSEHEANLAAMSVICGKDTSELNDTEYKALWQIAEAFPSELVENEEFGEVPKGWGVKKVGDIIQRLKNPQKLKKEHISNLGKTPVFEQGTSILMGYSDENASQNASKDEPIFIFGDHTCITHISTTPFSIYQNVIPLKGSNLPTYWVYWAIKGKQEFQEYRRHYMELIIKEVVIPNNITLCQFFSKLISPIHQKIDFFREENRNLSQTRDLLLPKLLSGEIHL